jgi:type VI secretion system secreted protein VgrG
MLDVQELLSPVISVKIADVKDDLRLQQMHGREALGSLFEYQLDLVNWDESDIVRATLEPGAGLGPDKLLGKGLTVTLPLAGQKVRHIHGLVTQAAYRESIDHHTAYRVTIRPRLWLLTLTHNCRVFQNKSVLKVVEEILLEQNVAVRFPPSGSTRIWDTLTQYRETDFDFINRLLAHEGFHYFFEHGPDAHTLVIADSDSAYRDVTDFGPIPIGKPKPIAGSDEHLRVWQAAFSLQTEAVTLADFDFRLRGQSTRILEPAARSDGATADENRRPREIYDFPAGCVLSENQEKAVEETAPGKSRMEAARLAGVQRDASNGRAAGYQGKGTVRWLTPGVLFAVEGCGSKKFLATDVDITLRNPALLTGETVINEPCEISLKALDGTTPFRLPLVDKPRVLGPQTAWVVGNDKEEITTDEHGRVRVHFHWDRQRRFEEHSSCWVRVAQPWAGNRWGVFSIPRVGSEVVVEFLYGDPDRPLVTGSVYGGENLPPYDLPKHQTRSGIKTRSSKGAHPDNYNEIRFEDDKGKEELHIQAERNLTTLVKHDQIEHINGERNITIKNGDKLRVIGSSKSAFVEGGYDIGTSRHFNLQVCTTDVDPEALEKGTAMISASSEIKLVCGKASLSLKQDGTIVMSGTHLTLEGSDIIDAKGTQVTVTGSEKIDLNGNGATLNLSKNIAAEGAGVVVTGKNEVHLVANKSKLDLDSNGVVIEGPAIKLN